MADASTPSDFLFESAYTGERESDATCQAVQELHRRATPEIFERALVCTASGDARWREIGIDVLSQLGSGLPDEQRWYLPECRAAAMRAVDDPSPDVVRSAASALCHLNVDDATLPALLALESHPDAEVRRAAAQGLMSSSAREEAGQALLRLMEDEDDDVRDWATCAYAFDPPDTPQARAALHRRWTTDPFEDARDEALWGLVRLGDREAVEELLRRYQNDKCGYGDRQAMGDLHAYSGGTPSDDAVIEATRRWLQAHH